MVFTKLKKAYRIWQALLYYLTILIEFRHNVTDLPRLQVMMVAVMMSEKYYHVKFY
jgi:hypothetical protein